jgi:hypothetical protein
MVEEGIFLKKTLIHQGLNIFIFLKLLKTFAI